ncbi:MAG: thiamine phosphate synthase, partial [Dehalococcoidia bacterium]
MAATIVPPIIALVTDRRITGTEDALVEAVDRAVGGGVNLVQLREKDLGQNDLLGLARRLRETIRDRALLFVNNEPNVALLSLADGVHLGESVAGLTRQAAAQGLVGRSVHDLRTAQQAADDGAHLLIAGPIHATRTHPGQRPAGLALVEEISGAVDVPVLGIGGITAANASDIIAAG